MPFVYNKGVRKFEYGLHKDKSFGILHPGKSVEIKKENASHLKGLVDSFPKEIVVQKDAGGKVDFPADLLGAAPAEKEKVAEEKKK